MSRLFDQIPPPEAVLKELDLAAASNDRVEVETLGHLLKAARRKQAAQRDAEAAIRRARWANPQD